MTSLRGTPHRVVADAYRWLCVVIIDHENPPVGLVPTCDAKDPTIALLKSDWDFLFNHLRSTYAVVRYLRHVVQFEPVALGTEWIRYGQIAFEASLESSSSLDKRLLVKGAVKYHSPLLSLTAAMDDDASSQMFYRMLLEEVAVKMLADPVLADGPRLDVLSRLDALPVSMRSAVARYVFDSICELTKTAPHDGVKWLTRTIRGTADGTQLLYGACSEHFGGYDLFLQNWLVVRHHDLRALVGPTSCVATVALVLTPRRDGSRPWDVTVCSVAGDIELDPAAAQATRDLLAVTNVAVPRRASKRGAKWQTRSRR
ncbi:MAG: hypothetical protein AB7N61_13210 [Acidimicrobiia bacterium]